MKRTPTVSSVHFACLFHEVCLIRRLPVTRICITAQPRGKYSLSYKDNRRSYCYALDLHKLGDFTWLNCVSNARKLWNGHWLTAVSQVLLRLVAPSGCTIKLC